MTIRFLVLPLTNEVWGKVMFLHLSGRHSPLGRHPRQTATAADGTHSTGMHSCMFITAKKAQTLNLDLELILLCSNLVVIR